MDQEQVNTSPATVQSHARVEHVDRQRVAVRPVVAPVLAQPQVVQAPQSQPVSPTTPVAPQVPQVAQVPVLVGNVATAPVNMPDSLHQPVAAQRPAVPTSIEVPQVTDPGTAVATANLESFVLPPSVISRGDVARVVRELDNIDDFFHQSSLRGVKDVAMPSLSRKLDQATSANGLNLLRAEDRANLKVFLGRVKHSAPVVHISFPAEAGPSFLAKILDWFRREIHPYTVLQVGLQPELVAGFMLRTTNKSFDFSFRKKFEKSKEMLIKSIAVNMSPEDLQSASASSVQVDADIEFVGQNTETEVIGSAEQPGLNPTEVTQPEGEVSHG